VLLRNEEKKSQWDRESNKNEKAKLQRKGTPNERKIEKKGNG
jgi:hypothetical protein